MTSYILRRILATLPTLFGLSVILFVMVRLMPGDAALLRVAGSEDVSLSNPAVIEDLRRQLGLDQPLPWQYVRWLGNLLTGDFGTSFWTEEPVLHEVARRLPITLELVAGSVAVSVLLGVFIGVISAVYQDTPLDYVSRLFGIFGLSIPNFWVGMLLVLFPALWFGYLPPLGYVSFVDDPIRNVQQFITPWLALGWYLSASIMRFTRSEILEVLRQDYVRTARAKGLQEKLVIYRHVLRNSLISVVTLIGLQIGFLLGGTVAVEAVYGLPGMGTLLMTAISQRDYPLIQAGVLMLALWFLLINLMVDVLYGVLDPRIRYQ